MVKSIYDLELHESLVIDNLFLITRVPGGWIYESLQEPYNSVFVPFNNEFESNYKRNDFKEYSLEEVRKSAMNMIDHGGGFVRSLGYSILRADSNNTNKLLETFGDYVEEYLKK